MNIRPKIALALLLASIFILSSCASNKSNADSFEGTDSQSVESVSDDADTTEYVTLYQNGASLFDVLYDSSMEIESPRLVATRSFYTSILNALGEPAGSKTAPRLMPDKDYTEDASKTVILFGLTVAKESVEALNSSSLDEYGYYVKGQKIVIYGRTLEELETAGAAFLVLLNESAKLDENKKPLFQIDTTAQKKYNNKSLSILSLPELTAGTEKLLCDDGDDARMWVAKSCTPDDFTTYKEALKSSSFNLYEENEINNNLYATFSKGDIIVDVWYTIDGYLRVTASKGFDLLPKNKLSYTKKTDSGLAMVGPTEWKDSGELTMFFLLEDGRFVVIDGGTAQFQSETLLEAMREVAPDPDNITIACWIFTHTHGDHIGAFVGVSKNWKSVYSGKLKIESFLYNLAGKEQALVPNQMLTADDTVRKYINNTFPDAKRYKAHPGNKISFANMDIEILATHESYIMDYYPVFKNACCLVLKITVNDQVIMIEGDTGELNNKVLADTYGSYLKCDILQATHHGNFGGLVEANKLFAPEVVLYFCNSTGVNGFSSLESKDYNQALINKDQNPYFKEYIVQDCKLIYLSLPYTAGTSQVLKDYST